MNENPKEVAVFKTYSKFNKLKVFGIAILIFVVGALVLYFPIKTLFTYTITFNLNGGSIYGEELTTRNYRFLQRIEEPVGVKKFGVEDGEEVGYYIDHWSKNSDLSGVYNFGGKMWNSFSLYIKWEKGVAVRLHFAENQENSDMSTEALKGYYEQYVKLGSNYTLPLMYNDKVDSSSDHYGEQLIWYDNPECTGEPFFTKTYINLTESVDIYGKWIDTDENKFVVDENGVLQKYKGYCNIVKLPSSVKEIKSIEPSEFKTGFGDTIYDQSGEYYSVWANVIGGSKDVGSSNYNPYSLTTVYLNEELTKIGDCAFRDCEHLENIIFENSSVDTIGKYAFANCNSLKSFSMPTSVQTISEGAFYNCFKKSANIELNLPNIYRIEEDAFINSKVKKIVLSNISFIGKNAFAGCDDLEHFEITCDSVPTSDVDTSSNDTFTNIEGIFYRVNYVENVKLQIIVPKGAKAGYLAIPYWNMYKNVIVEKN